MDTADRSADESVMIALLPTTTDWSTIELPHLTLVYAGLKKDLKTTDFNELSKDAAMLAMLSSPIGLRVKERKRYGHQEELDAFRLEPTSQLWAMRRAVERWNKSDYEFNPHVTIGPLGSIVEEVPRYIRFDRIFVGWGKENLTFLLRHD